MYIHGVYGYMGYINTYLINAQFVNQSGNLSCLSWYLTLGDKLGHH